MNRQSSFFIDRAVLILLAFAVIFHGISLVSLRTGWLNPLFDDSSHRFGPGGDFFSIYASGVQAMQGKRIYRLSGHVSEVPYAYPFRYAPIVAYSLAWLLALAPAVTSYGLWLVLCEFVLLWNIRLTFERAPDIRAACIASIVWLCFTPFYLELYVGQFTFITASLIWWAYLAWSPRAGAIAPSDRMASRFGSLLWCAAFWLKMMPALFIPIALLRGRWKGVLLGFVVLAATSWWYFRSNPNDWKVFLSLNADPHPVWNAANEGFMPAIYTAVNGDMSQYIALRAIVFAIVGGGFAWILWLAWRTRPLPKGSGEDKTANPNFERALLYLFVVASVTHLLLYKDVWEHHYVLLQPALVLLILCRERLWVWLPAYLVSAIPTLFGLYDISGLFTNEDPQNYWNHDISLLHHGWKPMSAVWLFTCVILRSVDLSRALSPNSKLQSWLTSPRLALARRKALPILYITALTLAIMLVRWAGRAILDERRLISTLVVPFATFEKQHRIEDCGPSALASVSRFYGVSATEKELASMAGTSRTGTSLFGLLRAARAKGLSADAWRVKPDQLADVPRPCILFMHPGHFVILKGVKGGRYFVADPSQGQYAESLPEIEQQWHGEVLVVGPPDYANKP